LRIKIFSSLLCEFDIDIMGEHGANSSSYRSKRLDQDTQVAKLQGFIEPVKAQWANDQLKQSLSSYAGFAELLALDKAQNYMARKRMHEIRDWGSVELDAEGQALQAELEERQTVCPVPLVEKEEMN
jgi:exportin-5